MEPVHNNEQHISSAGEGFVRTATAAPDFQDTVLEGIPDGHVGPTIVKRDYVLQTIEARAGESTYLLVTPSAATAYYRHDAAFGANLEDLSQPILSAFYFPDAKQLFKGAEPGTVNFANSAEVSRGRLMLLSTELNCVTNSLNQYGTISCYKAPLNRNQRVNYGAISQNFYEIVGVNAIGKAALAANAYVEPVRRGVYSVSMNRPKDFPFCEIIDDIDQSESIEGKFDTGNSCFFKGSDPFWSNAFDTIVMRIDVPAGVPNQSFVLKVWKAWEYQPTFNSLLYDFAHLSPDKDVCALDLYREIARNLPVAVTDRENPDFWNRILQTVDTVSGALSFIPGPIGNVASGVHAIASALDQARKGRSRRQRKNVGKKKARPKKKAKPKSR